MSDSSDADALPEALEASLYELHFEGDPASREARLAELCRQNPDYGDSLQDRAATLQRSDALFGRVRQQLDQPTVSERIGPFVVRSVLGQGGFGTVYLADQLEPVQRTVALKVLHPGRVDARALQRFEGERQVLARLQHACIAKVYDAGQTADGLHYFAMEAVAGKPVTTWCDAARMKIEPRLQLFLRVCAAIEHAHQRGVVHRDIKPSNVLVHEEDTQPVPKVIDFGVAKLLTSVDSDAPLLTREGAQVGTPGYMSPEQAAGEPIDTRADVYALGVLLCELLTADLPFARSRLQGSSFAAMVRILVDEEPRRPSQILLRDPFVAKAAADARQTSVASLGRELRADLDWVVLKAIAPNPEDRYASVAALADDVGRYLRREPVSVRERIASYWLRKFVARHRFAVTAAMAIVLLIAAGIGGLIWTLGAVDDAREDAVESGRHAEEQRDSALANAYSASMAASQLAMLSGDLSKAVNHLQAAEPTRRGWEWRHLAAQSDHGLKTIPVDTELLDVAWIDDEYFLGFEGDGSISVWSATTGERERTLENWQGIYRAFAIDRDRGLVVAADNNRVALWDYRDGRHLRDFLTVPTDIRSLAWSPNGRQLAIGSHGGRVDLVQFDPDRHDLNATTRRLPDRTVDASALTFVDDDTLLVALDSGAIERVAVATNSVLAVLHDHEDLIDDLLVDVANDRLFSASLDTTVCAWQLSTGKLLVKLPGQVRMRRLALSNDGRSLYAAGGWSQARVLAWDTATFALLGRYHGHHMGAMGLSLDPTGKRLLTSARDQTLRLWSATPPTSRVRLDAGYDARDLSVNESGTHFAIGSWDGLVCVWDAATLLPALRLETEQSWAGCALGKDTVYVASGVVAGFAIDGGARLAEGPVDGHVQKLAIDPEERWLIGGYLGKVMIWQLPNLELRHSLELRAGVGRAIYDVRTDTFLLGGDDSTIRWIDPERGVVVDQLRVNKEDAFVCGMAQRGDLLVTGSYGNKLSWRRGRGPMNSIATSTVGVAISPDGSRMATASSAHSVHLWDTKTMGELLVLGDLVYSLVDVYFVAGGSRIVALSTRGPGPSYVYAWSAPDEASLPR